MASSLHNLFQAIASARDQRELQLAVIDTVAEHFGVQASGIYLLNDQSRSAEVEVQGIPDVCVERNPILHYVAERHAPAHEGLVLPPVLVGCVAMHPTAIASVSVKALKKECFVGWCCR